MRRISGIRGLVPDAIDAITTLVEETQTRAAGRTVRAVDALTPAGDAAELVEAARSGVARNVFDAIRLVNRTVELVGDHASKALEAGAQKLALDRDALGIAPELVTRAAPALDALEAGLNALVGDFLAMRNNGLAITLGFYQHGLPLALTREAIAAAYPQTTGKVVVLVHGLGCTERAFKLYAREHHGDADIDYGGQLARDLGFTPFYVRYNTGRHISENGRALAAALDSLFANYPLPIEQLVLVGHSMGGLVSRSAAHYGKLAGAAFVPALSHVIAIGSPHLGAPLEKAGGLLASVLGAFPTAGTEVPARILNARSAGIKDLRFGYIVDEDWTGKDPDGVLTDDRSDVPMLDHVTYAFIAGSLARGEQDTLGRLVGDLLVRLPSSSGREGETRHIAFHGGEVLYGLHHMALINHPTVYAVLQRLLGDPRLPKNEADLLRLDSGAPSAGPPVLTVPPDERAQ